MVGLQSTQARSLLESNGFVVKEVEEFHEVAALGEVIRQDPPARQDVPVGSQIVITVSQGPEPIEIPDLKDKSEIEAANALGNLGFEVAFFEEESADVEEGRVIRTDPPAGEKLAPGGVVTVVLSTGKFVDVPNVVGLTTDEAVAVLRGAELQPSIETQPLPPDHPDDGKVIAQLPEPGTKAERASVVIIRVGVSALTPSTTAPAPTTTRPTPTTTVPIDITFTIEPASASTNFLLLGGPVLSWSVTGGDTVRVQGPNLDRTGATGSVRVCPGTSSGGFCQSDPGSYNYTLKVLNSSGSVVAERTVTLTIS